MRPPRRWRAAEAGDVGNLVTSQGVWQQEALYPASIDENSYLE
jgi:hypothetical protein